MALAQRIETLKKRHAQIEDILRHEKIHPASDDIVLHQLKREKLNLKDEMSRLMSGRQAQAA